MKSVLFKKINLGARRTLQLAFKWMKAWENLDLKLDFDFYDNIFKFLVGSAYLVVPPCRGEGI